MKRTASAVWRGTLKQGKGTISTESGTLKEAQYSFGTRFENGVGTNPEELIGAAHAGCFSMAFAVGLEKGGFPATKIETQAVVQLDQVEGGFGITNIYLKVEGEVPGIDKTKFLEIAEISKKNCPVSKVLAGAQIHLEAVLKN